MLVYDEVQMQVTKTVRNVSLLHGHRHEVQRRIQDSIAWPLSPRSSLAIVPFLNRNLSKKFWHANGGF